ncbi:unnamed protein product [Rotaria sordida]|uniref:EF-hand domain-containing protein n=1 Tax=Rotaria sordida TaxID=392033 RepID=A0A815T109_9BILA|nr:unnamed protein product [Rotaria sordida]CAF1498136.1 unnamed protein product [Rotaria sordida]
MVNEDHYIKTIVRRYEYCCPNHEFDRAFNIYDQKRNDTIELREYYRLIWIIERSIIIEKISNFIECVNMANDKSLNYEQFKQFVRLGHGREILFNMKEPMSNKTFTSESIISSGQEQSSMSNIEKINLDTQIDGLCSNSKNSSGLPVAIVETIQPSISSTTNPADSSINQHDKSYSYDIHSLKSIHSIEISVDDSQMTQNRSSIDEEERSFIDSTSNDSRNEPTTLIMAVQSMMNDVKLDFNKRFGNLDEKFQKKFDQLAQKLDNIYESNAITSIMNKIRADHNIEIPFLPTNRIFHSSYSKKSKILFSDFEQYLIENYKDR